MQNTLKITLTLISLCFSLASSTQAAFILSNMSTANDLALLPTGSTTEYWIGFQVGGTSITVDSLDLRGRANLGNTSAASLSATIRADQAGTPAGSIVGSFSSLSIPASDTTISLRTLTPTSTITLAANTNYWFGVLTTAPAGQGLDFSTGSSTPTTATLGSYVGIFSGTSAASAIDVSAFTNPPAFTLTGTAVSASAVPEPSSLALVGAIGIAAYYRRRTQRSSQPKTV